MRALRARLPGVPLLYLGDTARVPYGTRSAETVRRYALEAARFLLERPAQMVVAACNTVSAVALDALAEALPVPVVGVVEPGAAAAARATRSGRIGIIATEATVASRAYEEAIHRRLPTARTLARPCPLLVPLAEAGWVDNDVARAALAHYLADLRREEVDTLVLGCTHYPLFKPLLAELLGPGVTLVDSAEATAEVVAGRVDAAAGEGDLTVYLTDLPHTFTQVAGRFLGEPPRHVFQVRYAGG
ncbi:MAG: glutamate racemase [Nitrospirae bacterium]|nr:MAG: glutamate racemase [Nitrospirota bacterium]